MKNTVNVSMISDQDFGNYTCEATNDVNTDTSTVLVRQISECNIYCSWLWIVHAEEKQLTGEFETHWARKNTLIASFTKLF